MDACDQTAIRRGDWEAQVALPSSHADAGTEEKTQEDKTMRSQQSALILVVLAMCLLFSAGCGDDAAADEEVLFGTWINEQYAEGGKIIWSEDGTWRAFLRSTGDEPSAGGAYTIEEKWTDDAGFTYYQLLAGWSSPPFDDPTPIEAYFTVRIDATGETMATNFLWDDFPSEELQSHLTYYRQQPG